MKKHPRKGFTLLEIVASIFLFSIMTLAIASTMRETGRLTSRVKTREAKTLSIMIALDRLQRDLQMAYLSRNRMDPSGFKLTDGNLGSELLFSYLDSPVKTLYQRRTPGLNFASYKLEKEDNGTFKLIRTEVPFYAKEKMNDAIPQLLASGLLQFKMEAYDIRNSRWLKEWDDKGPATGGYSPVAVRITLEAVDPSLPKEQWKDKSLKIETDFVVLNELEQK